MSENDINIKIPEASKIKFESEYNSDGLFIGYKVIITKGFNDKI